ncbi:MAG TPA: Gldg family protein [Anaerolineales bacterium]|nr:Gldg family protein [Anaerolineales bacterium]
MAAKKKTFKIQRYAFIALIVAGVALVATILLAIVQGFVALKLFSTGNPAVWLNALWISLALTVIGIAAYGIMAPDNVRRFFTGRQARYGSNSLIMFLAVIGILFVINLLAFENPVSKDFTEDQSHTLAKETLQALANLPEKVNAIAFFSSRLSSSDAKTLLDNFKANSKGKFDYQFVDPDTNPVAARQAGVTGDGKIMLTMGTHKEIASSATETDLVRALIRLISPEQHVIYFLTGHGEADINGSGDTAFSIARSTLESKNYTVKTLNLLANPVIPTDAQTIVIAGPQKPLSTDEVSLLKSYVDGGKSLVVLEDPTFFTKFDNSPDPLAQYLISDWGITLDNDLIIDLQNSGAPLNATAASRSQDSPITENMTLVAILPQARSISLATTAPTNVTDTSLIQTSPNSWGETDFTSLSSNQAKYDAGQDIPGPLNMAVSGQNNVTNGRVVVFGNSVFAADGAFDAYGNGDIFINSVDWAASQENLINITPNTPKQRTFNIPSQVEWVAILLGAIFILPGLWIVAGVSAWVVQRRRG